MKPLALAIVMWSAMASAETAKRVVVSWQMPTMRGVWRGSFVVEHVSDRYVESGRSVPPAFVEHLVALVTGPPVTTLDPARMIASHAVELESDDYVRGVETVDADWLDEARSTEHLTARIQDGMTPNATRAPPRTRLSVDIGLSDGRVVHMSASPRSTVMLPWTFDNGAKQFQSWDPELSYAVARLIPDAGAFRSELSTPRYVIDFDRAHATVAVDPFEAVNVASTLSGSVGSKHGLNMRSEIGWAGVVVSPVWKDVQFDVFLTQTANGLASTAPFLADASKLVTRVQSLRWIHPHEPLTIAYHDDRPLTTVGRETLRDDLRIAHAPLLADDALDDAFAFTIRKTLWVLFADGTSMRVYGRCTPGPLCPAIGKVIAP